MSVLAKMFAIVFSAMLLGALGLIGLGLTQQTITIEPVRTAVDLEVIIERDDAGEITKIHRLVLWSDGRISFPDIPYYPRLVFSCRDCPHPEHTCPGDIDGDGVVGVTDLLIVQREWGVVCE